MLVRSCASVCLSSGRPGFFASTSCFASNGTGFGGGATWETTGRAAACAGGTDARAFAFMPRTLLFAGTTGAAVVNAAGLISPAGTATAAFATGSELVRVRVGTAVTAPRTL
jgi:hypothetical protein